MRKVLLLMLIFVSAELFGGGNWATSAVNVSLNGTSYDYVLNNEGWTNGTWGDNTAFSGFDFGTPVTLILNGGSGNAWTDDDPGYDATSFKIYYRVYLSTNSGGAWTQVDLDFLALHSGNNYIYDKSGAAIDVLTPVSGTPGTYNLEVVMSKNQFYIGGNWNSMIPGGQAVGYSADNAGYIATFTVAELPVELSSFTAAVSKNVVNLEWATATEINNYGFEVEKSADKTNWNKIGFVNGNGNSNSVKYYSYSDKDNTTNGTVYYRLKQLDNNGGYEYLNVVEANINMPVKFELGQNFPNPFNPTTKINYSIPEASSVKLTIYNAIGQVVNVVNDGFKSAGSYTLEVDGSRFNSGVYFYKLEAGNNTQIRKMVLVK